jgi:hypothetical protein
MIPVSGSEPPFLPTPTWAACGLSPGRPFYFAGFFMCAVKTFAQPEFLRMVRTTSYAAEKCCISDASKDVSPRIAWVPVRGDQCRLDFGYLLPIQASRSRAAIDHDTFCLCAAASRTPGEGPGGYGPSANCRMIHRPLACTRRSHFPAKNKTVDVRW